MRRAALILALASALWPASSAASNRYDPRLRFRTISTPRFDIHFHQREDWLARRLAAFVESVAAEVDRAVGAAVGRVQVILVDQDDLSNGWATPLPYNTIEITAAPPPAESSIGNTEDWLRLVFVHEYTHIAHLSRAGGWINGLRRGFGRLPLLFPNLYQPAWAIEGIATWQESTVTREGRVLAGDFRLLLDRAAIANRFEPLDRVNGGNVDWPGGSGPYLYGAYFHDFLARQYGADSIRTLAAETGRRVPYLGSRAYKKVFGRSLGQLWDDFEADARRAGGDSRASRAVRLTDHGFRVSGPRHGRDGTLFYSLVTPHAFPALMELPRSDVPAGRRVEPRRVTSRYLGGSIGLSGRELIVDELEFVQGVALQSDLWRVDPQTGDRTRLTHEARAADPDVSADGTVVCTVQMGDRRALATMRRAPAAGREQPQVFVSEPDVYFATPRWSPDGQSIAAERRVRGGPAEIILIDVASKQRKVVASLPGGRHGSPVWMPDGSHVLFAAAVGTEPFRLHRVNVRTGEVARLEGTGRSAESPDVSPDGSRIVFVGTTVEGYDLFALPLDDAVWTAVDMATRGPGPAAPIEEPPVAAAGSDAAYSPWRTLGPTFWTPTIESDGDEVVIGAATGTVDALGRHAYAIEGGWSVRARPDWQIAYAYDRWRPTLFAAYADDTDPWRTGELRTREVEAGLLLPLRRVRQNATLLASLHGAGDAYDCPACEAPVDATIRRASGRAGFSFDNAHEFGYSISAEEGGRWTGTAELSRGTIHERAAESITGSGVALTMEARRYRRGLGQHDVVAVRGAAAGFWGDEAVQQEFSASGNGPRLDGFGFGLDAIGLLRGFDEDAVVGTRAAVVNVDYRFPLWRIGRGAGTMPLFLRTVHGALFADAGHAWSGAVRWGDRRASLGGELSIDTVVGFGLPMTFTAGVAIRHDGTGDRSSVVAFGRVGRAF